MENLISIGIMALVVVVAIVVLAIVFSRLYRRATKAQAFVRTGMGGQKVIKDGGALIIPVAHEITRINLTTLKLPLRRTGKDGLITKDKMRVDVGVEFFVRVKPDAESISMAAQTLGVKTEDPRALTELIEGKLVDALRAVAAKMTLADLHEQRQTFVQNVQEVVSKDIEKNGLELESVSLTNLDQTNRKELDENNVFDAEGLRIITATVEAKKKERNDIERTTQVQIETRDLEATQKTQQLRREREYVELDTNREIAERRATTLAQTALIESEKHREAEQARITAEREIESEQLSKDQTLAVRATEKQKAVQLAEQDRAIAVSERSRDESKARAEADNARATAIRAEEQVKTAQAEEEANRSKKIVLIKAEQIAEQEAIGVRVAAKAEREAAEDRAEAVRVEATAKSEAEKIGAEGTLARYTAEATGQQKLNEAMNTLSPAQIELRLREAVLKILPEALAAAVKPLENIDSIRIVDVSGLNGLTGGTSDGTSSSGNSGGSLSDQIVSAGLRHRAAAPVLDSLMLQVGMNAGSLDGMLGPITTALAGPSAPAPGAESAPN